MYCINTCLSALWVLLHGCCASVFLFGLESHMFNHMPEYSIHIGIVYLYSNSNNPVTYYHCKIFALAGIWTRDLPGTKQWSYLQYPGLDWFTHLNSFWSIAPNFFSIINERVSLSHFGNQILLVCYLTLIFRIGHQDLEMALRSSEDSALGSEFCKSSLAWFEHTIK